MFVGISLHWKELLLFPDKHHHHHHPNDPRRKFGETELDNNTSKVLNCDNDVSSNRSLLNYWLPLETVQLNNIKRGYPGAPPRRGSQVIWNSNKKLEQQPQQSIRQPLNYNKNKMIKQESTKRATFVANASVILFTCIILFTTTTLNTTPSQAIYLPSLNTSNLPHHNSNQLILDQQQQQQPSLFQQVNVGGSLDPKAAISASSTGAPAMSSGRSAEMVMASGGNSLNAIAPTIDYSHNMRILKLPKSTPIGSIVYRLKGSDGDSNTQLYFGVSGGFGIGRILLDVVPVLNSWNEADVFLRSQLEQPIYNLTVYVTDGNHTTQVESTLIVTNDEVDFGGQQSSNIYGINSSDDDELNSINNSTRFNNNRNFNQLSPFVNPKHIFHVPENAKLNEAIGHVTVMESYKSDLPVRFELRGRGSDKFAIKYVFGPKGQSKGEIILARDLDYEKQNLFTLKVLALNAWTNTRFDTRNVATLDIVITVGDLQDTGPIFKSPPQAIKIVNTLEANALVTKVEAEDGDFADQRPVQYALDANSPLSNYFSINKQTGEIHLLKSAKELALHAAWDSADWSILSVFASEVSDTSSYDHLWPPMYAKLELPLRMVDVVNEPPIFVGGWQTIETNMGSSSVIPTSSKILHGYISEISNANQEIMSSQIPTVKWFTNSSETGQLIVDQLIKSMGGKPLVLDLGIASNGTFELSLDGPDAELFIIEPAYQVTKQTTFTLSAHPLANRSLFDYEHSSSSPSARRAFQVDIVANDFGSPIRKSSRIKCLIELIDVNDNSPQFETDLYSFAVYENAQVGTLLGTIRARDPDTGSGGRLKYSLLSSPDDKARSLFQLDQDNGQLTLAGQLDREFRSNYLLFAEARDFSGGSSSNFTQILISILDVNDNPPQFLQSHYDAVLLADGTFHQPLVVKAVDGDQENSANSQVAYEIIAGNSNQQFSIDTVSGVIYPTIFSLTPTSSGGQLPGSDYLSNQASRNQENSIPQIPPILSEPIMPFNKNQNQAGKILPSAHEVEETTVGHSAHLSPRLSSGGGSTFINSTPPRNDSHSQRQKALIDVEVTNSGQRPEDIDWSQLRTSQVPLWFRKQQQQEQQQQQQNIRNGPTHIDAEQLPALDLLLNLESDQTIASAVVDPSSSHVIENNDKRRSLPNQYQTTNPNVMRVPPITTLVVRAHDFGIPLRSSTVRVNIFNQALLSRSISVILNGTADQLELRREAIERAFSSVTGSKATIESIDSLSDSSSISIARVKLAVPHHSLVDLTDLSGLMTAIDYKPNFQDGASGRHPMTTHYINDGGRLIPLGSVNPSSANITNNNHQTPIGGFYTDIQSTQIDHDQQLERRLLIYIIIVVVCIAILLLIWILYYCSRESRQERDERRLKQLVEVAANRRVENATETYGQKQDTDINTTLDKTTPKTTDIGIGDSPIRNNLSKATTTSKQQLSNQDRGSTANNSKIILSPGALANGEFLSVAGMAGANLLKPDHLSMYNGQVWFEPAGGSGLAKTVGARRARMAMSRRASSAPSGGSIDSVVGLNPQGGNLQANSWRGYPGGSIRDASGQFFPNTTGYMENLDAISVANQGQEAHTRIQPGTSTSNRRLGFNGRNHKVAPMENRTIIHGRGHLNEAFEPDEDNEDSTLDKKRKDVKPTRRRPEPMSSRSVSSAGGSSLGSEPEVVLDSDQELLGFDSTGTPIIATHTQPILPRGPIKTLVLDIPEHPLSDSNHQFRRPNPGGNAIKQEKNIATKDRNAILPKKIFDKDDNLGNIKDDEMKKSDENKISNTKEHGGKESEEKMASVTVATASSKKNSNAESTRSKRPLSASSSTKSDRFQRQNASSQGDLMNELNNKLDMRRKQGDGNFDEMDDEPNNLHQHDGSAGKPKPGQQGAVTRCGSSEGDDGSQLEREDSGRIDQLSKEIKNGEMLEKQSIFTITYSGLTTDKLPS